MYAQRNLIGKIVAALLAPSPTEHTIKIAVDSNTVTVVNQEHFTMMGLKLHQFNRFRY